MTSLFTRPMIRILVLFFASLSFSVGLSAAESEVSSTRATLSEGSTLLPQGVTPLLGISTGYMSPGEASVEGVPSSIKLLGTYYSEPRDWVADAGLGFQYQLMNNGGNAFRAMSELAWRYRWNSGWQVGPVMNTLFHEGERYGSANRDFVSFIGAQVLKEFRMQDSHWRAGLSAMTDMDIRNDVVNTVFAHLHITFGGAERSVAAAPVKNETPVVEAAPREASHLIGDANRRLENSARGLSGFGIGQTDLSPEAKNYLNNVAGLLKSKTSGIQKISVLGHADKTGTEPINQRVSAARARAAAQYLIAKGVPKAMIEQRARSSKEPISEELALNRRVEIQVLKAKNKEAATGLLKSIR